MGKSAAQLEREISEVLARKPQRQASESGKTAKSSTGKQFTGREIEKILGDELYEDGVGKVILQRQVTYKPDSDGYGRLIIVMKHPNGKLYKVKLPYAPEESIYRHLDDPKMLIDAVEVVREGKTFKVK